MGKKRTMGKRIGIPCPTSICFDNQEPRMHRIISVIVITLCSLSAIAVAGLNAQTPPPDPAAATVKSIQDDGNFKTADNYVEQHHDAILQEWTAITEINAPSGQEKERAAYLEKLLHSYGLSDIHYDGARNLIGVRRGVGGGPAVVFDAHMDTVFQPGLKIKASVREGRIYAPGVGDDTRNIEA